MNWKQKKDATNAYVAACHAAEKARHLVDLIPRTDDDCRNWTIADQAAHALERLRDNLNPSPRKKD